MIVVACFCLVAVQLRVHEPCMSGAILSFVPDHDGSTRVARGFVHSLGENGGASQTATSRFRSTTQTLHDGSTVLNMFE